MARKEPVDTASRGEEPQVEEPKRNKKGQKKLIEEKDSIREY